MEIFLKSKYLFKSLHILIWGSAFWFFCPSPYGLGFFDSPFYDGVEEIPFFLYSFTLNVVLFYLISIKILPFSLKFKGFKIFLSYNFLVLTVFVFVESGVDYFYQWFVYKFIRIPSIWEDFGLAYFDWHGGNFAFTLPVVIIANLTGFIPIATAREKKSLERIEDLIKEKSTLATLSRLEGQNIERKRLARDLHDGLGGKLSTVKLYYAFIDSSFSEIIDNENREHIKLANELLDQACEDVRRIAYDLESGMLGRFGLVKETELLADVIEKTQKAKVKLYTYGSRDRLSYPQEVIVYRIIQELITNALKHSRCTEIVIQLNYFPVLFNVIVEDNGIGFQQSLSRKGLGLTNVFTRVSEQGGELIIDSSKNRGTTISFDILYKS